METKIDIDKAIKKLEFHFVPEGRVPGTMLCRSLLPGGDKVGWCLSVGVMLEPKAHFYGEEVEDCIKAALKTVSLKRNDLIDLLNSVMAYAADT